MVGLADGGFVATWTTGAILSGQRYDANGVALGDNFTISTSNSDELFNFALLLPNGDVFFTWTNNTTEKDIYGRLFTLTSAGETWVGGNDADTHVGTAYDDEINAGNGKDVLFGGGGDDFIYGEGGSDILIGGAGNNVLSGGNGADTFIFGNDATGNNLITDFKKTDHLQFADGVTVLSLSNTLSGTDLVLSNGGSISLIGVTASNWQSLL